MTRVTLGVDFVMVVVPVMAEGEIWIDLDAWDQAVDYIADAIGSDREQVSKQVRIRDFNRRPLRVTSIENDRVVLEFLKV